MKENLEKAYNAYINHRENYNTFDNVLEECDKYSMQKKTKSYKF